MDTTIARAVTKFVRISPSKARLVADLIRGKNVDDALTILRFTPKKGARLINKTLRSAIANAEHSEEMDMDNLYVHKIHIDDGPTMRRFRPRAQGRVNRILKRSSHITVVLAER